MWTCWVSLSNNKLQHLAYLNVCLFICCAIRKKFAGHRRGEKKTQSRNNGTRMSSSVYNNSRQHVLFVDGEQIMILLMRYWTLLHQRCYRKKMWNVISRNRLVRFIWCGNTFLSTIRMLNRSKQTEISRARVCVCDTTNLWYVICMLMYKHQFYMSADR